MAPAQPRPLSRARRLADAAFLRALRRTGNVREAARLTGTNRATLFRRRAADPAFAADWAAALTLAAADLAGREAGRGAGRGQSAAPGREPEIVRRHGDRLQLRRRVAGHLTPAARTAFLAALSSSANVRLSAAAAGFSHAAFYGLKRRDPGFAREWRLALQQGYEALERALIAGFTPESTVDDAWRHNEPPAIPPMSAAEALQLLYLHQKEARLKAEPFAIKRRRGESREAYNYPARRARRAEDGAAARGLSHRRSRPPRRARSQKPPRTAAPRAPRPRPVPPLATGRPGAGGARFQAGVVRRVADLGLGGVGGVGPEQRTETR